MTRIATRGSAMRLVAVAAWVVVVLAGCTSEPAIPLDAPEGWTTDDRGRWWRAGVDTAVAFRDLSTFEHMGVRVPDALYRAGEPLSMQRDVARSRMVSAVQRELAPLYRNRPETVDSLFWRYVEPSIEAARPDGDPDTQVAAYEREAYRLIMRHFRAPGALKQIGPDIPVSIPDSLRAASAGQAVSFQVYVGPDGSAQALRQLEGVHPVLDRIALRAVVQVPWQPAYVLRTTRSVPVDGWVRFGVRFPGAPDAE